MTRPPHDLLLGIDELAPQLRDAVQRGDDLNAYLFAAAMDQVADSHVHADRLRLGAVADMLTANGRRLPAAAGGTTSRLLALGGELRARTRATRATLAWQHDVAQLVALLAHAVCNQTVERAAVATAADAVLAEVDDLPAAVRSLVPRLPSCFHAFDLDIPDVRALVDAFVADRPDRSTPLLVVGVRTGGGYLAPLCAALLAARGFEDIGVLMLRPEWRLFGAKRRQVRDAAQRGGLAVVVDDPPASGRSVARVADTLRRAGFGAESIVLLLPVFGAEQPLAPGLDRHPAVLLPEEEWAIAEKLRPESLRAALGLLLPDVPIDTVTRLPLPVRRRPRSHARALFHVEPLGDVLIEGAGIGYYGEQVAAVAHALGPRVPRVFGVHRGCVLREWIAEDRRRRVPDEELVDAVAEYVLARRRTLPATRDKSLGHTGDQPVWEVAGALLARAFGRGALVARMLFTDALARRVLRVRAPSVIDGDATFANWFAAGGDGELVKVDFAERSFWNIGLLSYDAVYDLAGAAVSSADGGTADALRTAYERHGGEPVGEARWLLYELAQLWALGRTGSAEDAEVRRRMAGSLRRFFARLYLADLEPADGPVCLLDLDGVLETETLGFPGTTADGATALRALVAHGYRPVLVTGRSESDVAERCRDYRLVGGVAEYGAAVHTVCPALTRNLLDDGESDALARVRDNLSGGRGIELDDAFRRSVRARGVDAAAAAAAVAAGGGPARVRFVVGESQTDFVPATIDKARGARALLVALGSPAVALAVGDTLTDLPMLGMAERAYAPAHARAALGSSGISVVSAPYQAGLALAVKRLIGHAPGACPVCCVPDFGTDDALVVAAVSAGERGRIELVRRALRLAWQVQR